MKFISLKALSQGALAVIRRFPFEVIFALIGCIAATAKIELNNIDLKAESWYWRLIMMANLGFLLCLSATLISESKRLPLIQKLALRVAAAAIAVVLMYAVDPYERRADVIRFFLISLAFHLLVSFAGFTHKGGVQGFWQFNKSLFLRFLTSVLYSIVLYAGLAAAIGALNFLFNFKFEWDTFSILWIWIAGMFNTLFFLAGVPADLRQLDADQSYPKGLKIFTQFVLIPLAAVYVVILLAYEVKIALLWSLPKGMVSSLILGYAVFGILALLLVYPVREQQDNKWIKTYARSFYFLLLPLLVLLFLAVGARVFKYGVTEYRYFLIVLAFWLLFISIYFLVSQRQNIKLIPISLCVLTLLAVYGPQSAFKVSTYSQERILLNVMTKNKAYRNGLLLPVDSNRINKKDAGRAVAVLNYLIVHDDLTALQPYFRQDLERVSDSLTRQKSRWNESLPVSRYELVDKKATWARKQLHLDSFSEYEWANETDTAVAVTIEPANNNIVLVVENSNVTPVSGYDYMLDLDRSTLTMDTRDADTVTYDLNQTQVSQINHHDYTYTLKLNKHQVTFNTRIILDSLVNKAGIMNKYKEEKNGYASKTYTLPSDVLTTVTTLDGHRIALRLTNVNFYRDEKLRHSKINYLTGVFLIKW